MKKIYKHSIISIFTLLILIGVVAFQPSQKVYAGTLDNAIEFYNAYGVRNEITYSAPYFYFGGRSKNADSTSGIKYRTVGYKVNIQTATQLVSVPIPESGNVVASLSSLDDAGYHYNLKCFDIQSLKNLIQARNTTAYNEFCAYGGTIQVDSYMIVVYYGTERGSMDANGNIDGTVYDTWEGIAGAQAWGDKNALKSYYKLKVNYLSNLMSLQIVGVRYQNPDGGYTGYSYPIWNNYFNGEYLYWGSPEDGRYYANSLYYLVNGPNTSYITVNRKPYQQRTFVQYQDENGNYGGCILVDTKNPLYESTYGYTFPGDATYSPVSVPTYIVYGAKDNYIQIPRIKGKLTKPELTVQNPNDAGVYYDGGIYYLKADDTTKIKLSANAKLNPVNRSRIDKVTIAHTDGDYHLSVPRADVANSLFLPGNVLTQTTLNSASVLYPKDNWAMTNYNASTFQFAQDFVMNDNREKKLTISDHASCVDCTNVAHDLSATGNTVTIRGDNIAPTTKIITKDAFHEDEELGLQFFGENWTNAKTVTLNIEDIVSGIKSYTLTQNGVLISTNTYATYTTKALVPLPTIEGESPYVLTLVDNVGNTRTYNFSLHVDTTKPTIKDMHPEFGASNVYTTDGPWPVTNVDATWDYNWVATKLLTYQVTDVSGIYNLNLYNYGTDETFTTVKSQQNFAKNTPFATALTSVLLQDETGMFNGKNHLKLVVEDKAGNKTSVKLVVRIDNKSPQIQNLITKSLNIENYTIADLNTLFQNGDVSLFNTKVNFIINEHYSTPDTSGIGKVEVLVKDPTTGVLLKTYDVTSNITSLIQTPETKAGKSIFTPRIRNLSGEYYTNINTLIDLPDYSTLSISVKATDIVGNVEMSGENLIANYATKSVVYATKNKAYNLPLEDGTSNIAYFKTGEVGYLDVWTVGYVDKLEFDFSHNDVGQTANKAIGFGQLLPKYILGVHGTGTSNARYITNINAFKVPSAAPDVNGVSFLSHLKYTAEEVNQSIGDFGIKEYGIKDYGWADKGTMIRIPPSFALTPKTKTIDGKTVETKDRYGMQLFHWKNCFAYTYASKNNVTGPIRSTSQYTIWDESGDDLHYRSR